MRETLDFVNSDSSSLGSATDSQYRSSVHPSDKGKEIARLYHYPQCGYGAMIAFFLAKKEVVGLSPTIRSKRPISSPDRAQVLGT